jgi:hypothetical protein
MVFLHLKKKCTMFIDVNENTKLISLYFLCKNREFYLLRCYIRNLGAPYITVDPGTPAP